MPLKTRIGEIALTVLAMSTAASFMFAALSWYMFDWPAEAHALMVASLVNASIGLASLPVVIMAPLRFAATRRAYDASLEAARLDREADEREQQRIVEDSNVFPLHPPAA